MTDKFENSISAFNWQIYYFGPPLDGELNFNEICCLIVNEFTRANVVKIERNKQIIKISLPITYTYGAVLKKLKNCSRQTLLSIDHEEEEKLYKVKPVRASPVAVKTSVKKQCQNKRCCVKD